MLKPTAEQRKILTAGGRVVTINARAGTGKTATLAMIAQEHPDEKILYLVYFLNSPHPRLEDANGPFRAYLLSCVWKIFLWDFPYNGVSYGIQETNDRSAADRSFYPMV